MKLLTKFTASIFIVLLASLFTAAQGHVVNVNQLTTELQKDSPVKDEMTLVWWIPQDYWRAVLEEEKLSKAQIEEFLGVLRPYTIVAVFDGKLDANGKANYRSEADVLAAMRIIDAEGSEYRPLSKDKVGTGVSTLLNMIRPLLANALGPLGANFHFVALPGLNAKGEPIADPRKDGTFRIRLDKGREFTWTLPLTSLVPPRTCPIDGAKLNGNWRFCPFHGAELKK